MKTSFDNALQAAIRIFYQYGAVNPQTVREYYNQHVNNDDIIGPRFIAMRIAAYKQYHDDVSQRLSDTAKLVS